MAQPIERNASLSQLPREREKAIRLLAQSIYKDLRESGYGAREVIAFSTEVIGLVTADVKGDAAATDEPQQPT